MDEQPEDYAALKRRLLGRILFAVVVLAGLLASLAVFDRMNAPEPVTAKPDVATGSRPAGPTPKGLPADTIKSEVTKGDSSSEPQATATATAVPEVSSTPQTSPPLQAPGEKPLTKPATGRHALMRSPDPVAPAPLSGDASRTAPPSRPATATPRAADPVQPTRPIAQAAEKPFALQLGVFSDLANAEELRAKLEKAGIKATIEARVQVGPFATRAEADAARAKLRELGISEALLVGMKARKGP